MLVKKSDDIQVEKNLRFVVSKILRFGVLTAATITFLGGILFFIQHPESIFEYSAFNSEPARLTEVFAIISEAFLFKSRAVIQFGILVLITTPVLRVLFSLIGFLFEKDWIYVVITGIVITVLFFSIFG